MEHSSWIMVHGSWIIVGLLQKKIPNYKEEKNIFRNELSINFERWHSDSNS